MQILQNRADVAAAQASFESAVRKQKSESIQVTIGFPSGNKRAEVLWLPALDIWAYFSNEPPLEKSPGERYWNVFGIGKPSGNVNIACEINPPKEGINRLVAGAFATDSSGRISVVHRGFFNAGGRIPYQFTRKEFAWQWTPIVDGYNETPMIVIGTLDTPSLPEMLSKFVFEAMRLKKKYLSEKRTASS